MKKNILPKIILCLLLWQCIPFAAIAQRFTDKLDRGLVATIAADGRGNFVSWRIFGEEYYNVKYNLYADGSKVVSNLNVSNYVHLYGTEKTTYQVAPVVNGVEGEKCPAVVRWVGHDYYSLTGRNTGWLDVPGQPVINREGQDVTSEYGFNDVSLADVNGDGVAELIVKRVTGVWSDNNNYNLTECYDVKGNRLWWIDMGPNLISGPDEQYDVVAYDWDQDGKAEVLLRGADNMLIHMADGSVYTVGDGNVDLRSTAVLWVANMNYTFLGKEYLLYLDGTTGKPYQVMDYPCPRVDTNDWGDGYGHRATKHYFGAPFLDGRNPYIFIGRGCYTQHKMATFRVDKQTHALERYWYWECKDGNSPYFGQGFHNFSIADVDMDGRDEVVFGSMVIDDNGKGLSTTGLGHGDAQHCTDLDPYRWGLEQFSCLEHRPCNNYRNATTSKIYFRTKGTGDDGRALAGNFDNLYPGSVGASMGSGGIVSLVTDRVIPNAGGFDLNSCLYWEDDLCREVLNSPGLGKAPKVDKVNVGRIFLGAGNMNNGSKNNPGAVGDLFGDWREEMVVSCGNALRIHMANYPTTYRIPTLWHDHQYRNAMVWQCMGYNQPPHISYFMGQLEDLTVAPPPLTNTGRTEIANGGSIGASNHGQHVMVAETNSTQIHVQEGANPLIATFNVPSWVQGTDSKITNGNAVLEANYYTCQVSGSGFSGATRVVKQGEGILELPTVTESYTGSTDIWGGVFCFNGTLLHSNVWMNHFTKLISEEGHFRNVNMKYASELLIGQPQTQKVDFTGILSPLSFSGADEASVVTMDTLSMGFGARLLIDVFSNGDCDRLEAKVLTLETKNWQYGPKYWTPVFVFHAADQTFKEGEYVIAQVDSIIGSLNDVQLEGIPNTISARLERRGRQLLLVLNPLREPLYTRWDGQQQGIWDFAKTANFLPQEATSTERLIFATGDRILFSDESLCRDIQLRDQVEAAQVNFQSSLDYSISGKGAIVGNSVLNKSGSGKLTLNTDNTYTGGNRLSEGIVSIISLSNESQAYGNLGGITTNPELFIMENGATLLTTGAVTQGSPMRMQGEQGGILQNGSYFNMDQPFSGSVLTKKGGGWLRMNAASPNLERLIIADGTVKMQTDGKPAATVEFRNGTLDEHGNCGSKLEVPADGKGIWKLSNRQMYANSITGEGTLEVYSALDGTGAARTPIACNFSKFTGKLVARGPNNGIGSFTLDNNLGLPLGTLEVPGGVYLMNTAKTFYIGKLIGDGNLSGVVVYSQTSASGANTWQVGCDQDFSFGGLVTDNSKFIKVGTGTMTVSGAWTCSGMVTLNQGALELSGTGSLGIGQLYANKGATLTGRGTLNNSSYMIRSEASVVPGVYKLESNLRTGCLAFSNNLTFMPGANLQLNIRNARNSTYSRSYLTVEGQLSFNGNLVVTMGDNYVPVVGDSIILWQAQKFRYTESSVALSLPDLSSFGLTWDTSNLFNEQGVLRIIALPDGIQAQIKAQSSEVFYSILGIPMGTNPKALSPGIYIRNGKKQVIK